MSFRRLLYVSLLGFHLLRSHADQRILAREDGTTAAYTNDSPDHAEIEEHGAEGPDAVTDAVEARLTDALTHLSSLHHADHELAVKALEELASPLISDGTWWNVDGTWWDVNELSGEAITHMAHAAYWLAVLRSSGLLSDVIAQNDEIAYKLLQGAAARGLTDAHQALGYRHATGYKNKTDCELAYSHLKEAGDAWLRYGELQDQDQVHKPAAILLREYLRDGAYKSEATVLNGIEQVSFEQELAMRGHGVAQTELGYRMLLGVGMDQNLPGAHDAFQAAAANGDAFGLYNLGVIHNRGIGVPANIPRALEYFEAAARQGVAGAYNAQAAMYFEGVGVPMNKTKAMLLWEKGAELEDSSSQYSLGVIHLGEGSLVEINVTRAQAYLEQALAGRQWKAAWLLSQLYMEDHESLGKNCTKALEYMWTFIAQTSDLSSVSQEAFEKLTGHPLTAEDRTDLIPEPFRALLLYAYLAEKGSVSAGMNAGWMLERGQGLPLSTPQGAAEQSEPLKENRVHAYGMQDFAPTTESLRLAAYYYGRAAATNHTPAMVDYANLLVNLQWALKLHGSLVIHTPQGEQLTGTQLVQKGLELYADAKARRDSEAATNLAWAHFAGVGVEQDLRRAQELYHEAAEMARDGKTGFAPLTALMLTRGLRWGLPLRAGARVASWVGGQREGGLLGRLAEWSQMVTKAIAV